MESRVILLTEADINNHKLNIRACGEAFFPKDAIGGSTKASPGVPVTIIATRIAEPVKTDIPREKNCDRIRWFFRERKWVRTFIQANSLIPGDQVRSPGRVDKTISSAISYSSRPVPCFHLAAFSITEIASS